MSPAASSTSGFKAAGLKALLFDLDGTLADSTADLAASGNWLRLQAGLPALEPARIGAYVGDGVEALVSRLLERPAGELAGRVEDFKRHYGEHCLDRTRLYPGVAETLRELKARGYRQAVVTNKPERISRRMLEGLGVGSLFGAVVGGNSCAFKKPRPEPLWLALEQLGSRASEAAMVGDSRVDVEAARAAGMPCLALLGGIGDPEQLRAASPDATMASFSELLHLL